MHADNYKSPMDAVEISFTKSRNRTTSLRAAETSF